LCQTWPSGNIFDKKRTDMTDEKQPIEEQNQQEQPIEETIQSDLGATDANESLQQQLAEANDKFLRLYAEFDNYKRRTMKERSELLQTAGKDIILSFLPIIDDFERAMKASETASFEAYKEGVQLIHNKFNGLLTAKGLKPVESIGQPFNVDLHEAITNIPAPSEAQKGMVIDETEKGYTLNGHVIRFAKVIVGE